MGVKIVNGAWATLASSLSDVATTLNLTAGHGARFGTISSPDIMYLTLIKASSGETEHIKVTNRSTDTLTIVRAQGGSSAIAFDSGDRIECRPISSVLDHFVQYDASGNVGLGIAAPGYKLHLSQASGALVEAIVNDGTTNSDTSQLRVSAGTNTTQVITYGDGSAYVLATVSVAMYLGASSNVPVIFLQNNTERARIDANGYLLAGYTSSNGAYKLQVNGQIFATSATIATSDGRYKEDVQEIQGALDIVQALRPVSFRWKAHPIHDFDLQSEQLGFVAQEVDAVLANASFKGGLVKSNRVRVNAGGKDRAGRVVKDGIDEEFLGLAEGQLIPILAAALKELKAIVDAQADRIAALEGGRK